MTNQAWHRSGRILGLLALLALPACSGGPSPEPLPAPVHAAPSVAPTVATVAAIAAWRADDPGWTQPWGGANRVATQLENDLGHLKSAAAILLTLPGAPFLYYGEEVGLQG